MLFQLSYKNTSNQQENVWFSGSSMSTAILYCDSNNFTPQILSLSNNILIVNVPSSTQSYAVALSDNSNQSITNYVIYDTYENVSTWIQAQTNKSLNSISYANKALVVA